MDPPRQRIDQLRQRIDTTFIYVTHDQTEAMTLGDRIVIMKDGFIQQIGTPQEVFNHPYNLFVATFIGTPQMNMFENAKLVKADGKYAVQLDNQTVVLSDEKQAKLAASNVAEQDVVLGVRPEDIHDEENFIAASPDTVVKAFIEVLEKLGAETQIYCKLDYKEGETVESATDSIADSSYMVAKIDSRSLVNRGEVVELALDARHIHLFDGATEMSILSLIHI